jgi:hypothetical protein
MTQPLKFKFMFWVLQLNYIILLIMSISSRKEAAKTSRGQITGTFAGSAENIDIAHAI